MSHRLRSSKYRHVYTDGPKPEGTYTNVVPYPGGGDHQGIKMNTKFFAVGVTGGGGPVLVHPLDKPGVIATEAVRLNGHTGDVLDMDFHPFYQDLLVTGSVDCRINLWRIPDGGPTEDNGPLSVLQGCKKKVMYTLFNPVADNILATADGGKTVNIFDVQTSQLVHSDKSLHKKLIQDLKWNGDGSQVCTSSKDRSLRFFDPRAPGACTVVDDVHKGLKTFKMCFLDNHQQYISVGFNRQARREMKTFDARTHKVLDEHGLDQSSGLLFPFYDQGTNLLYLIGRGDSNVRIFERTTDSPYLYECSNERVSGAVKGVCMAPKRLLDVENTETTRFLKMTSDQIQTIKYTIPRRDGGFQEDLFPDDYAGVPALSAEAWLGGENAQPVLMSLDPAERTDATAATFEAKAAPSGGGAAADPEAAQKAGEAKNARLEKQITAANAKIKELEERRRVLNGQIAKKEKEAEEAEVAGAMAEVRPGMEVDDDEEDDDDGKWEEEEATAPAPAPEPEAEPELPAAGDGGDAAPAVPADCKNPELYAFLASDKVQMANLYDKFVEGGISTLQDLKDIESVDEFVEDFGLKKAQARKVMKALA